MLLDKCLLFFGNVFTFKIFCITKIENNYNLLRQLLKKKNRFKQNQCTKRSTQQLLTPKKKFLAKLMYKMEHP